MRLDRQLVRWIHGDSISLTVPYYIPCFQEPSTWENPVLGTCVDPPMVFDRTTDELGWVTARDPWLANVSHSCWYIHDIYIIYIYIYIQISHFCLGHLKRHPLLQFWAFLKSGGAANHAWTPSASGVCCAAGLACSFGLSAGRAQRLHRDLTPDMQRCVHTWLIMVIYIYIILYIHTYTNIGVKTLVPWWTQKKLVSGCSSP